MNPPKSRGRLWRRVISVAASLGLGAFGLAVAQAPANAAVSCSASYAKAWDNGGGGFGGLITITNSGDPITAWTLTFTFPGNQRIQNGWDGNYTQATGSAVVTITNASYNGSKGTGATWTTGFNASYTGTNTNPASVSCTGTGGGGTGGDTQAPSTPSNLAASGTTSSGTSLAWTASTDNVGVTGYDILQAPGTTGGTFATVGTSATNSFAVTGLAASSTFRFQVRARDAAGNTSAVSNTVTVTTTGGGGTQSLVVSAAAVSVPEGSTATYTVRLNIAPTANVTVTNTAATTGDTNITVSSGASLTFTPANFATPQTVTLAAAEDADTTNGSRNITVASTGLTSVTVAATEADNDTGGGTGHVDNPYAGATGYVNANWSTQAAAEPGGSRVSNTSTGVWIDRIAAIAGANGSMGVQAHLDAAVQQDAANGSAPLTIQFVIYDLPNRDCSALASNGELLVSANGLNRYKTEYIDPIAAIMSNSAYANLRIVTIVEIDSLPNLVTNTNIAKCAEAQSSGAYVQGIQYALNKLHAIPNVYTYIDAAHHGWIGWSDNFNNTANLLATTAEGTTAHKASVDGFIVNTANYSALTEPFIDINGSVGGQQIKQSKWVDFNQFISELPFAQSFRDRLVQAGFPSTIGMLIDTSRNGWGGSARPTGPSSSTVLDTFVNQSKVDRRIHAGNWCNQSGAGLGERPRANPATGIDAYVWIKPPGESDGASSAIANDEGKGFDRMCDPTYTGNDRNGNNMTGALPNSPLSGHWFSAQFQQLMTNAFPPLS
ncbi:glycoside hydrolase family 6 protein [Streptosporangiaceae bacterium NEAU-GS5]|nr:glycoside hydrolase family 6 protein [Streptosporangiaceae bacterium NEAU-GS5]